MRYQIQIGRRGSVRIRTNDRVLHVLDGWEESAHPRDASGKFVKGAGGGGGVLKASDLTNIGGQLGSNPGGKYKDKDGKEYYVKQSKSEDHAKNELLASRLYELAGSPVLKIHKVDWHGDKLATATEWQKQSPIDKNNAAHRAEAKQDFATHAWLANWDAVGLNHDNQGIVNGKMTTLDPGGALLYRAQGAPKGTAFGNVVGEWDTLRGKPDSKGKVNQKAKDIFGDITDEELKASVKKVAGISDAQITDMVMANGPGSEADRMALAGKLLSRKRDLILKSGIGKNAEGDDLWKNGAGFGFGAAAPAPKAPPPAPTPVPPSVPEAAKGTLPTPQAISSTLHGWADTAKEKDEYGYHTGISTKVFGEPGFATKEGAKLFTFGSSEIGVSQMDNLMKHGFVPEVGQKGIWNPAKNSDGQNVMRVEMTHPLLKHTATVDLLEHNGSYSSVAEVKSGPEYHSAELVAPPKAPMSISLSDSIKDAKGVHQNFADKLNKNTHMGWKPSSTGASVSVASSTSEIQEFHQQLKGMGFVQTSSNTTTNPMHTMTVTEYKHPGFQHSASVTATKDKYGYTVLGSAISLNPSAEIKSFPPTSSEQLQWIGIKSADANGKMTNFAAHLGVQPWEATEYGAKSVKTASTESNLALLNNAYTHKVAAAGFFPDGKPVPIAAPKGYEAVQTSFKHIHDLENGHTATVTTYTNKATGKGWVEMDAHLSHAAPSVAPAQASSPTPAPTSSPTLTPAAAAVLANTGLKQPSPPPHPASPVVPAPSAEHFQQVDITDPTAPTPALPEVMSKSGPKAPPVPVANLAKGPSGLPVGQGQPGSPDWHEDDHKRDANGRFMKMAAKMGLPSYAATKEGVFHELKGPTSASQLTTLMNQNGFKNLGGWSKSFATPPTGFKEMFTKSYKHPVTGHTAVMTLLKKGNGHKVTQIQVKPNPAFDTSPGASVAAPLPAQPAPAPAAAGANGPTGGTSWNGTKNWEPHDHLIDANGKHVGMAKKFGLPESAATFAGVTHQVDGPSGSYKYAQLQNMLTANGFNDSAPWVSTAAPPGYHKASTKTFLHPDTGDIGTLHFLKKADGSESAIVKVQPSLASKTKGLAAGQAAPPPAPTPAAPPPPATTAAKPSPAQEKQLHAAAKISHEELSKVAQAAGTSLDMHAVASSLRPDPNAYKHPNDVKWMTNRLAEADAALKSGDPLTALQALKENKSYPKFTAYKNALIAAHKTGPAASQAPTPAPAPAPVSAPAPAPSAPAPAPVAATPLPQPQPKGGSHNVNYKATGVHGVEVRSTLHLNHDKIIGPPPPHPKDQHDYYAWNQYASALRQRLSTSQETARASYQGSGYREINKAASGVIPMTPALKSKIKHLDEAMDVATVPMDISVTRGISSELAHVLGINVADPTTLHGKVFEHKGFMSTSRKTGFGGMTVLKFNVPKGSRAICMPQLNAEEEVLLPRNSMLRITKVEKGMGNHHVVHCEYLGSRTTAQEP